MTVVALLVQPFHATPTSSDDGVGPPLEATSPLSPASPLVESQEQLWGTLQPVMEDLDEASPGFARLAKYCQVTRSPSLNLTHSIPFSLLLVGSLSLTHFHSP